MRITRGYKTTDIVHLQAINTAVFEDFQRASPEKFKDILYTGDVWVARRDEHNDPAQSIIGFVICDPGEDSVNLRVIAVRPDHQGRGVGGNLLREVIGYYAKEKKRNIRLHVYVHNPAQTLYYNYGFRVYSLEPNHYGEGYTALMMKRNF